MRGYDVSNAYYVIGNVIGNTEDDSNWTIESMDHNLITKVSRVFTFSEDDKNIRFSFEAADQSNNTSGSKESQSFTIDTKAPTVTGISFSKESADGITEIKPDDFIEKLEYGYYFKDEMIITADCEDTRPSSGLKMMTFRFVPYKDGEQIEQEEYAESKKADVEDIVISKKAVDGKASCTVEKGFKGQIFVTAYDYAAYYYKRNTSKEITTQAFVIEDTAPEIKIDEIPETDLTDDLGNKLYTEKVAFKVTITDTESGLREITYANRSDNIKDNEELEKEYSQKIENVNDEYDIDYVFENTGWTIEKMDNNLVTQVSQTFVFEKDDKNICMIFGAADRANNESEEITSEKFTIDTVAPTIERFNFEPASEDDISEVKDFIEELEYGFYFKKPFNATVSVDDKIPSSGLETVVFRLLSFDKGEQVSEETYAVPVENKKAAYLIPQGFKGQIYAQVNDRAKNKSPEQTPQAFVVEENPPIIKIDPLPDNNDKTDMNGNKLYTHGIQFRVTVSDDKSGLRSVSYSKDSEKDSFNEVVTEIDNVTKYEEGDTLDNGWQIVKMDKNLITEISQVFSFDSDDNYIVMTYQAVDRSKNTSSSEKSECFTIDTTAPIVRISYPAPVNGSYYKDSVTFNISITERNFDPALMNSIIKDSFRSNNNIQIVYSSSGITEHTATVTFPEGDYEFTYSGEDRGGNQAQIYGSGSDYSSTVFSELFNVDATAPFITTNFDDFVVNGKKEYYFNKNKTVEIDVIEHNFYADDIGITFEKKSSGSGHTGNSEGWYSIGGFPDKWKDDASNPDHHVLSIELKEDAIYRIKINPIDRAGNKADAINSSIFEIDKEAPHLVSRNGVASDTKGFVESPFIDIYDEKRKDDPAPVLVFDDNNYDRMVIKANVLKTKYIDNNQIIGMETDDLSKELSKTTDDKTFDLSGNFNDDGVYILSFTVYDKAGNVYKTVNDTYFKMVKTDIIAYISNSDAKEHTGYYSLMDENQKAISKKASDFSDLDIVVVTKKTDDSSYSIEIKDNKDQQQYLADDFVAMKDSRIGESKAAIMKEFHLPGSYFSETFKDDSMDARMDLSVLYNNSTSYYLSKIHIDNEKPTAVLPEFFHSWGSVMFTDSVDVTLSNISEKLDISKTKIYECPRSGERKEILLSDDSYDEKEKSLMFSLQKGVHNIDITLVDEAGNEWNIDRIRYFTVGNFWMYLGIGVVFGIAAIVTAIITAKKHKKP